jgi:hypothetical protein
VKRLKPRQNHQAGARRLRSQNLQLLGERMQMNHQIRLLGAANLKTKLLGTGLIRPMKLKAGMTKMRKRRLVDRRKSRSLPVDLSSLSSPISQNL